MIDWENITKSDCILCILRDKETKKAKRFEWTPHKLESADDWTKSLIEVGEWLNIQMKGNETNEWH